MPPRAIPLLLAFLLLSLVSALKAQAPSGPEIKVMAFLESEFPEVPQGSTWHVGTARVAHPQFQRLTIANLGQGPLTVHDLLILGTHADDFSLEVPMANTVIPANGGTSFFIDFKPRGPGLRTATVRILSDDEDEGTYEYTLTGTGDLPGIEVTLPDSPPLQPGALCAFGTTGVLEPTGKSLTFTITNTGIRGLALNTSPLAFTGQNPADFSVSPPFLNSLDPGSSLTFTVRFAAKGSGTRNAALRLQHNVTVDGAMTPFDLNLTGTGAISRISLDSDSFIVMPGATEALIKLKRTVAEIPGSVKVQVGSSEMGGVFSTRAEAGTDYTAFTGAEATVTFAAGEAEKTFAIPLLPVPAARAALNRFMHIHLAEPSPGSAIGTIPNPNSNAFVLLLGTDSLKPTLTLTTPLTGKVSAISPLRIKGKTQDVKGISRVEVKLNNAEPVIVTHLFGDGSNDPTKYGFFDDIEPVAGLNVVVVTAYDFVGNSTSLTRNFTFERRHRLTLKVKDTHWSSTVTTGASTWRATPAAAATLVPENNDGTTLGNPGIELNVAVVPGTKLQIGSAPKAGYVFDSWARDTTATWESMQGIDLGSDQLFTMPAADVTLTVAFVPSPFAPPQGVANTMNWLLKPDSAVTPSADLCASLTGTLTATGGFSGKLLVQGRSIPVVARINGSGPAVFTMGATRQLALPFPGGELLMRSGVDGPPQAALRFAATGTSPWTAGRWAAFGPGRKVPSQILNDKKSTGYYTFSLTPTDEFRPLPAGAPYPRASGYATLTLSNVGQASITGFLADGTSITSSTTLVTGDLPSYPGAHVAPVFIQLPTPGAVTKLGLLMGEVCPGTDFGEAPPLIGGLQWYRPATTSPKVIHYPQGWPQGFDLRAFGKLYRANFAVQHSFDIPYTAGQPNLQLSLTGGGLTNPVIKTQLAVSLNTIIKLPPADASFTLSISQATGLVTGTFTPTWATTKTAFKGILIYDHGLNDVTGFFINNAKTPPADRDGSGAMTLGTPPQE